MREDYFDFYEKVPFDLESAGPTSSAYAIRDNYLSILLALAGRDVEEVSDEYLAALAVYRRMVKTCAPGRCLVLCSFSTTISRAECGLCPRADSRPAGALRLDMRDGGGAGGNGRHQTVHRSRITTPCAPGAL